MRIREDAIPFAEGLVGGNQHGAALVSCADEFEQDAGIGLVFGDIGDVVEDQQVEFVEFRDGAFEDEVPPGLLQLLNHVERQPPCPRATTTLAGFQAAEVGVSFNVSG